MSDLPQPELDDPLREELKTLYGRLDDVLRAEGAHCNACGQCCRFDDWGHQMWLTNLELAFLIELHGAPSHSAPSSTQTGVCPWFHDGHCGARSGRAIGCRVFHCQMTTDRMEAISGDFLNCLKEIAGRYNIDLRYEELLRSLGGSGR